MKSSNFGNHLKTSTFKKLKHLLYEYYPRFVEVYKKKSNSSLNRFDINQFLVFLYYCMPNLSALTSF